jgi:hypothetical protein
MPSGARPKASGLGVFLLHSDGNGQGRRTILADGYPTRAISRKRTAARFVLDFTLTLPNHLPYFTDNPSRAKFAFFFVRCSNGA